MSFVLFLVHVMGITLQKPSLMCMCQEWGGKKVGCLTPHHKYPVIDFPSTLLRKTQVCKFLWYWQKKVVLSSELVSGFLFSPVISPNKIGFYNVVIDAFHISSTFGGIILSGLVPSTNTPSFTFWLYYCTLVYSW